MSREKWSKTAWSIIIFCFIVLIFIGQQRIKKQNEILTNVVPRSNIQISSEENNPNENKTDENINGRICDIVENNLIIIDNTNTTYSVKSENLVNYRTRENINIENISVGDYYKNSEIIRNISGDELKKELLLNLSRCFNSSKLSTGLTRLKRLKAYDGYVTFKVSFYDNSYSLFEKEKPELFNIELIANENTVLYARTNIVTIYNLQKSVRTDALEEKNFYLGLDENTLNDERPLVTDFEIAEP